MTRNLNGENQLQDYTEWLKKYKDDMKVARYHEIQYIMWTAHLDFGFNIEELQTSLYRKKVSCARICCLCKFARKYLIASRLNPKSPRASHYGFSKVLTYSFAQLIHAFDIYTDLVLAIQFYILSREDIIPGEQKFNYHYNIGCTIVLVAIFGPYII